MFKNKDPYRLPDTASESEKQDALDKMHKAENKRILRGKIIFVLCLILGFITASVEIIGGALMLFGRTGAVSDSTKPDVSVFVAIFGVTMFVACYMLLKGFSGARAVYSVGTGAVTLAFLYLLLEDTYKLIHNTPDLAVLYLAVFLIYSAATIAMPASGGIKEYLYEREVKSHSDF